MGRNKTDIETYLVYVDADRCDGCDLCVIYCPTDVFVVHHKAEVVRPVSCLGCGTCVVVCPVDAVTVTEI